MIESILRGFLHKFDQDFEEDLINLFETNRFDNSHPNDLSRNIFDRISNYSKEHKFDLPEEYFFVFYELADIDFDRAFFNHSSITGKGIIENSKSDINLEEIQKLSLGVSKIFKDMPVIECYNGNKFNLPRLMLYQNGEVQIESEKVNGIEYTSDFRQKLMEELKNSSLKVPIRRTVN